MLNSQPPLTSAIINHPPLERPVEMNLILKIERGRVL